MTREEALNEQPCEDAISRQAVKEQMIKYGFHAPDMTVTEFVEDMPSVSTEKTGNWRPVYQGDEIINYRCSECELGDTNGSTNLYGWDYCRRCGAKMEVEDG